MPLKRVYSSESEIPEALKSVYVKDESGVFVLDAEPDPEAKTKVNEFRENNIRLAKEKEQLAEKLAAFQGVDPNKYKEAIQALEKLQTLEEKDLLKDGKVDEVIESRVNKRIQQLKQESQTQIEALTAAQRKEAEKAKKYLTDLAKQMIDGQAAQAVQKYGQPKTTAMDDIINRARAEWEPQETDDGLTIKSKAYDEEGQPYKSMDEWAKSLPKRAPHFFEASTGSGASGNRRGGAAGGKQKISLDEFQTGKYNEAVRKGEVEVDWNK
jgi:anion-transporting  ArsA/GET3 family ATPase